MKYISDDRKKVFDTEKECLDYEKMIRKQQENEVERKNKLNDIDKVYQELQKKVIDYNNSYGVKRELYFTPLYDLLNILCN